MPNYLDMLRGVLVQQDGVQLEGTGKISTLNFVGYSLTYSPITGVVNVTGGGGSGVASGIINDSVSVAGSSVADALDALYADITSGSVPGSRTLTAGTGLTGGGDLTANRTFNVVANADGTIVANANDIQVGVLVAGNYANNTIALGRFVNAGAQFRVIGRKTSGSGAWEDCTLAELGITAAALGSVVSSTTITAGAGLTGGGDLSTNRTIDIAAGNGTITVNTDSIQVGTLISGNFADNTVALTRLANAAAQFRIVGRKTTSGGAWEDCTLAELGITATGLGAVPTSRTVTAGAGLTGGGDLSANRTIDLATADGTITVNADSIQVGTIGNTNLADNTIALGRFVNAGAQFRVMGRKTVGAGAWEDCTLAELGITSGDIGAVPTSRTVTAGAGLTGGGDLSANRTIDIAAGNGTITVNTDSIQVGTLIGSNFANDTITLPRLEFAGAQFRIVGRKTASSGAWEDCTLAELGITASGLGAAVTTRTITAGAGLTGGGDLSANRTIDLAAADSTITVNADSIQVGIVGNANLSNNTIALARLANAGAQFRIVGRKTTGAGAWEDCTLAELGITSTDIGAVPTSRTITAGAGLTGGGDLTANRTLDIAAANTTITVNADSIQVGTLVSGNFADNTIALTRLANAAAAGFVGATGAGAWGALTGTQAAALLAGPIGATTTITNITMTGALAGATSISVGASPALSGAIRLANNQFLVSRNSAGTADINVIGVGSDNVVYIGDGTNPEVDLRALNFADIVLGGNLEYRHSTTRFDMKDNFMAFNDVTTTTSGKIRVGNNPGVLVGYTSYAGTSRNVLSLTGDGATFDDIIVGESNATDGNTSLYLGAKTQIVVQLATSNLVTFSALGLIAPSVSDASASVFRLRAAGSTASNNSGGKLRLDGGRRAGTGNYGPVAIRLNADDSTSYTMLEATHLGNARRIVSLCRAADLTTTEMPTDTGDLVMYIGNAATAPTASPVSGGILYCEGGALKYRGSSDTVTTLGAA